MSSLAAKVMAAAPAPRESVWPDARADANRIKLSWLLRLHWLGIVGQLLAIVAARWVIRIDVPVPALLGVVAAQVTANLALEAWLRRRVHVPDGAIAATMFGDAVTRTVLLALSGGYSNPFSTMYLVNVALASILLDAAWAWAILATSLGLFGSLFAFEHVGAMQVLSDLDHEEIMALHMQGMWVAFAVAAAFIVYIVQRVHVALTRLQGALDEERSASARKDKVASLATLAAGAAHELSTPLSTIAVVVHELRRSAEKDGAPQSALDDLALVREQVGRCRDILHHMSAQAGENMGEPFLTLTLAAWVDEVLQFLPGRERVRVEADVDLATVAVHGPRKGLARALRGLLKNALQASGAEGAVVLLKVLVEDGLVIAQVRDRGPGMPADILSRAGEPFFTTKLPGEGMGLGLFLTQTLAQQLGGGFELRSEPGAGTHATLRLPVAENRKEAP